MSRCSAIPAAIVIAIAVCLPSIAVAQSTGQITGTVTNAQSSGPLPAITLQLFNTSGLVATASTDAAGNYSFADVAPGTYFIKTQNASVPGFVDELYDNKNCPLQDCVASVGTPIVVTASSTTAGINITLSPAGAISGTVIDAVSKAGLSNRVVDAYDGSGRRVGRATTTSAGTYVITRLPGGTYFLQTGSQAYKPRVCNPSCGPGVVGRSTPVAVAVGATTTAIDFEIVPPPPPPVNGAISGSVLDAATGLPVSNSVSLLVNVYTATRGLYRQVKTDATGNYLVGNVEPGTYYVSTGFPGFVSQLHAGVSCSHFDDCQTLPGTPIVVVPGATTGGIHFRLQRAGMLSGKVIDLSTSVGLSGVDVEVYDVKGRLVSGGSTIPSPPGSPTNYWAYTLATGSYYVRTRNTQGYVNQAYPGHECPNSGCPANTGTLVQVTNGSETTGINFSLRSGGQITGTVVAEGTNAPIHGVYVEAYETNGQFVGNGVTNATGTFELKGLASGAYYLRTQSYSWSLPAAANYLDELHGGKACPPVNCVLKDATPIQVTASDIVSGIQFSLKAGSGFSGKVTNTANLGLSGVTMFVYNSAGTAVTTATTAAGAYTVYQLDPGTYHVRTGATASFKGFFSNNTLLHELYDNKPCPSPTGGLSPGCTVTTGTPVTVTAGATTGQIDFELAEGASVSGWITDASTNSGLGVFGGSVFPTVFSVDFYNSSATLVYTARPSLFSSGSFTASGLPSGIYYLRAGAIGYLDQLYGGLPCTGSCDVTQGTPVTVIAGSFVTGINFSLIRSGSISGIVRDANSGEAINALSLVAYNSAGTQLGTVTTDAAGEFEFRSSLFVNGTYFVRTASDAHINQVYSGRTCTTADCASEITRGTAISVTTSANTPGIDFRLIRKAITARPSTLRFAATRSAGSATLATLTPAQEVVVDFTANAGAWTATTDATWVQITGGSGTGPGRFAVSINASNPPGTQSTYAATILLTPSSGTLPAITIPVRLSIQESTASHDPFGTFDTPAQGATIAGSIAVTGWALDDIGVQRVELWRDLVAGESTPPYAGGGPGHGKVFIANAYFITGARPDVSSSYVDLPQADRAGWGYLLLTQGLPNQGNGPITLHAFAYDMDGHSAVLGSKTVTANNAAAIKPFGSIDTPSYGETVTGNLWNFGWALTPNATPACSIGPNGVQVSIDSGPLQPVGYGALRTDIAAAFPGLSNGNGAGGAFFIDTRTLTNGPHQIGWYVVDNCNRAEGIGSRFFTVLNQGSGSGEPGAGSRDPGSAVRADRSGASRVVVRQGERIELPLGGDGPYAGFQIVNGQRRPLPIGSSLDVERGVFFWQPGPGFLGAHDLELTSASDAIQARIIVGTAVQAVIDPPASSASDSSLTIAGWAIDEAASAGTGVDTVHVWAYPAAGGEAIFLGIADYGGERPDIAALFGEQFGRSSYSLTVGDLAPGTYNVVVYPHSAVTGDFHGAKVARITVP